MKRDPLAKVVILFIIFMFFCCSSREEKHEVLSLSNYEDLVKLFKEWHDFQKPEIIDGVPDYTAAAMEKQRFELKDFQDSLAVINPSSWPLSRQVDYHLVRAQMTGLDDEIKKLE